MKKKILLFVSACCLITTYSHAQLTVTMTSSIAVLCNGNTASDTAHASGGTLPYTFSWSPAGGTGSIASGLTAGNYTCTVTDGSSAVATATVSITVPTAITATVTPTNVTGCFGGSNGSATVAAGGGTGSFYYVWSSGSSTSAANNLVAGNYTVTVTDANSCIKTATTTITQPAAVTATVTPTNALCYGNNGSAKATASGGIGAYTYA